MSIETDNYDKFLKYFEIPPHPSYIAGFIDGDGSISIFKIKDGYNPRISISQCRTNILLIVNHHFGGFVQLAREESENNRTQFNYINRGDTLKFLVNYIKDHIIIKKLQIDTLFEFLPYMNKQKNSEIKDRLCQIVLNANKTKIPVKIKSTQINDFYLAGIFDAEGCILIRKDKNGKFKKGTSVKITQKNNPNILFAIKDYLGYGKVYGIYWIFFGNNDNICYDFISRILDNCIVKYNQLIQLRNYLASQEEVKIIGFCDEINKERYEIYKKVLNEKHESENFHQKLKGNRIEFNYPNFGLPLKKLQEIDEKSKKTILDEIIVEKEILATPIIDDKLVKIEIVNDIKNKKELSEEHCKKISDSTFGKHRSISDDKIREILKEKTSELTQKEIADKHSLSRSTIQTILSGRLIPTDEIEKRSEYNVKQQLKSDRIKKLIELGYSEKESFTISGAITKREIEGKYMVNIWYFGKLRVSKVKSLIELPFTNTSPNLSIYVSNKLGIKVSENMIKNIWNKKTQLYIIDFEEEFPVSFQNYVDDTIQENPIYFNLFEN